MKLPQISYLKIEKILLKNNFDKIRQKGGHVLFRYKDGRTTIIPKHSNEDINPNLLNKIIKKDLLISRDDFLKML
jgi:predicted RNA binding protein YcfA (HicA-like mRNA interferase family)